ncbi:hypothetical protein BHM03_00051294 [Ensete ventricosum]|nr:hypothetical protein BHM03_00051294 [Ensete ventricosum]
MKGVTHGAVDYLIKPVRIEPLKNIWQHVVRKKRFELRELEHSGSLEESEREDERHKRAMEEGDNATSGCAEHSKNIKRKKEAKEEDEQDVDEQADPSQTKKPRVVWSSELHQQFVTAVNQLGIDSMTPHILSKYRLYLRRLSVPQHQDRLDGHFTSAQEATFRSVGTVDGFDLQALAVSGQLLPQNLSALSSGSRRVTNTGLRMPVFDEMGFLNSGNASSTRPASVQQMNRGLSYFSGYSNSSDSRQLGQNLAPKQNKADFGSSLLANQDSIAAVQDESSGNTCTVRKENLSVTTEIEDDKIERVAQCNSTINSIRLKSESMPDIKHQEVLYDNIISNDLMDVGKQQQEGIIGQDDPEFFDAYSLENISM